MSKIADSARYQDYVFRDGQLVGRFDEMYSTCPDPWSCVSNVGSLQNDILCTVLRSISDEVSAALDVGCGLGALTSRVRDAVNPTIMHAVDVSARAIEAARANYPGIRFGVHDLLNDRREALPHGLDLITMAEVCWYIIPGIAQTFGALRELLNPGGHLLILQHFYRPEEQQYGVDVMRGPHDLVTLVKSAGFRVEQEIHLQPDPPMKALVWARKA